MMNDTADSYHPKTKPRIPRIMLWTDKKSMDEFLDNLCSSDNPAGMYIAQKCGYRFKTKETVYGADSSYCWDVVAAAYINHPEKFTDHPTPCLINEKDIGSSGFLHPCSDAEANNVINIPFLTTNLFQEISPSFIIITVVAC